MPELPEVEVLARHLRPLIRGKTIRGVDVRRAKVLAPTSLAQFRQTLLGAKFTGLSRRGKYLLFQLRAKTGGEPVTLLGHLGMTGPPFAPADSRQNHPRRGRAAGKGAGADFAGTISPNFARRKIHRTVTSRQISSVSASRENRR